MKVGSLVRIKDRHYFGLFVIVAHGEDRRWAKIVSLRDTEVHHELLRSLEVINESR